MGEIAELIIDGIICQICCCPLEDEAGIPTTCPECAEEIRRRQEQ